MDKDQTKKIDRDTMIVTTESTAVIKRREIEKKKVDLEKQMTELNEMIAFLDEE